MVGGTAVKAAISRSKLTALDGLRGFAAFIVVIHHYACALFPALIFGAPGVAHSRYEMVVYKSPLDLVVAGNFAVCIFFVISGFVLTQKFFKTGQNEVVVSSALRRYFRLMPPVLAAVLLSYGLNKLGLFHNQYAARLANSAWFAISWTQPAHILNALAVGLYHAFITSSNISEYDNVLWTMRLEFIGSFLVFAVALLAGKLRNRWLLYIGLGLLFWQTYYLAFLVGLVLSDLYAHGRLAPTRLTQWLGWPVFGLGLIFGSLAIPGQASTPLGRLLNHTMTPLIAFTFYHILAAALIFVAVLWLRPLTKLLMTRLFQYLGMISFSLYLVHQLVLGTFGAYAFDIFLPHLGYVRSVALCFILSLPIIFFAATVMTRLVDQPAIRFSSRLYRRFFAPRQTPPINPDRTPTQQTSTASSSVLATAE